LKPFTIKPATKLSQRAANVVYWCVGIFALTASATILHAKDDASTILLVVLGLAPLLLAILALPFFPDADDE